MSESTDCNNLASDIKSTTVLSELLKQLCTYFTTQFTQL